jgi:hypothetical protein
LEHWLAVVVVVVVAALAMEVAVAGVVLVAATAVVEARALLEMYRQLVALAEQYEALVLGVLGTEQLLGLRVVALVLVAVAAVVVEELFQALEETVVLRQAVMVMLILAASVGVLEVGVEDLQVGMWGDQEEELATAAVLETREARARFLVKLQ